VPVLILSAPLTIDELVVPGVVASIAPVADRVAVCTPVARSIAFRTSEIVPCCR